MQAQEAASVWAAIRAAFRSLVRILSFLLSFGMCLYAFSLFFVDSTEMHDGPVMAVLLFLVALPIGYFGVYGFPRVGFMEQHWKDVRNYLGQNGVVAVLFSAYSLLTDQLTLADAYLLAGCVAFGFLLLLAAWRVHANHSGD